MLAAGLRWHLLGFVLVVITLLAMTAPAWLWWSVCGWSVLLLIHWLYVKSISVDTAWIDRRAREVQYKSYDFSHIQLIKKSYNHKP